MLGFGDYLQEISIRSDVTLVLMMLETCVMPSYTGKQIL